MLGSVAGAAGINLADDTALYTVFLSDAPSLSSFPETVSNSGSQILTAPTDISSLYFARVTAAQIASGLSVLPDYFAFAADPTTLYVQEIVQNAELVHVGVNYDRNGTQTGYSFQVLPSTQKQDVKLQNSYHGPGGSALLYDTFDRNYAWQSGTTKPDAFGAYTVWQDEYYLVFEAEPFMPTGPLAPPKENVSGRLLVATGDPSGQRTTSWGHWIALLGPDNLPASYETTSVGGEAASKVLEVLSALLDLNQVFTLGDAALPEQVVTNATRSLAAAGFALSIADVGAEYLAEAKAIASDASLSAEERDFETLQATRNFQAKVAEKVVKAEYSALVGAAASAAVTSEYVSSLHPGLIVPTALLAAALSLGASDAFYDYYIAPRLNPLIDSVVYSLTSSGVSGSVSGKASDGPLSGATVFFDANGDGVLEPGETFTTTDATGAFRLPASAGVLTVTGGVDIATGLANSQTYRLADAPAASATGPLTTLAVDLRADGVDQPDAALLAAFNLDPGLDLNAGDPFSGAAKGDAVQTQALIAQALVADTAAMLQAAFSQAGVAVSDVYALLAAEIDLGKPLALTTAAGVSALVADLMQQVTIQGVAFAPEAATLDAIASVIAAANALLLTPATGTAALAAISSAQRLAQALIAPALAQAIATPAQAASLLAPFQGANLTASLKIASMSLGEFFSTPIVATGAAIFDVAAGATQTVASVIADPAPTARRGVVVKQGAGELILGGANTYTGGTRVEAGVLQLSGAGTLGAASNLLLATDATAVVDLNGTNQTQNGGVFVRNGATIENGTLVSSAGIVSTGGIFANLSTAAATILRSGVTTLGAGSVNSFSAGLRVNAGATLSFGAGAAAVGQQGANGNLKAIVMQPGATLALGDGVDVVSLDIALGGDDAIEVDAGAAATLGGAIRAFGAPGRLHKQGDGALTLAGAETYSGGTLITAGTLRLTGVATLGPTAAALTVSGATAALDLGGGLQRQDGGVWLSDGGTLTDGTLDSAADIVSTGGNFNGFVTHSRVRAQAGDTAVAAGSGNNFQGGVVVAGGATFSVGARAFLGGVGGPNGPLESITLLNGAALALGDGVNVDFLDLGLSGDGVIDVAAGATATISTRISDAIFPGGVLDKQGDGTLILTGASAFSGGTQVEAGVLKVQNATGLSAGPITVAGPTAVLDLTVTGGAPVQAADVFLANGGTLMGETTGGVVSLGGTLNGVAANQTVSLVSGVTTVAAGSGNNFLGGASLAAGATLAVGAQASLGGIRGPNGPLTSIVMQSGSTLALGDQVNVDFQNIFIAGDGLFSVASGDVATLSGGVADTGGSFGRFVKQGDGTVILAAANTFSGGTRVEAGTLEVADPAGLGAGGIIVTGATAVLDFAAPGGAPAKTGDIILADGGTLMGFTLGAITSTGGAFNGVATTGTVNLYSGVTTVAAGSGNNFFGGLNVYGGATLAVGAGANLGGIGGANGDGDNPQAIVMLRGATLALGDGVNENFLNVDLSGDGVISVAAGEAATISGVIANLPAGPAGILDKRGDGTLTLTRANSYVGGTRVLGGTLRLSGAGGLGATSAATLVSGPTATLDLGGGSLTQAGGVTLVNGGTLTNGVLSSNVGLISNGGTLNGVVAQCLVTLQSGVTNVWGGNNFLYGAAIESGATLAVAATSSLGGVRSGAFNLYSVTMQAGATLALGDGVDLAFQDLALAGDSVVSVAKGDAATISGVVFDYYGAAPGLLDKQGDGALILGAVNTYGGGTLIRQGTLKLSGAGTLGVTSNVLTVSGVTAVLDLGGGSARQDGGVYLADGGALTDGAIESAAGLFSAGGILSGLTTHTLVALQSGVTTLSAGSANNLFAGLDIASGATLTLGAAATLAAGPSATIAIDDGATLALGDRTNIAALNLNLSGAAALQVAAGATATISSSLLDAPAPNARGLLDKQGGGTLVLAGAGAYSGGTILEGGELDLASVGALGAGTLTFAGPALLSAEFSGQIATSLVVDSGASAEVAVASGDALTLAGDLLQGADSQLSLGAGVTVSARGASALGGSIAGAGTLALAGGGATTIADGATISTAAWTLAGAGSSATVNGNLGYAGAFAAGAGVTFSVSSGDSFTLTGTSSLNGAFAGAGTLRLVGGTTSIGAAALSIARWTVSGAATSVNITGSFVSYGGVLTLRAGANIAVAAKDTLRLTGTSNLIGDISGAGTLALAGGATTFLSGATVSAASWSLQAGATAAIVEDLTYAGAFSQAAVPSLGVGAGFTLTLAGSAALSGLVKGPGTLALSGTATLAGGAVLNVANWSVTGAVTIAKNFAYAGSLVARSGARFTLSGGNAALTLQGRNVFSGATIQGAGTLTTAGGAGSTTVSGLTLGGGVAWNNIRAITQTKGLLTLGDASGSAAIMTNARAGTYNIADDSDIVLGGTASIVNVGVFDKAGGSDISTVAPDIANSGVILAASGTLELGGAISGAGGMQVRNGAILQLDGRIAAGQLLSYGAGGGELFLNDLAVGGRQLFGGTIHGWAARDLLDVGGAFGGSALYDFHENSGHTGGILTISGNGASAAISFNNLNGALLTRANFSESVDSTGATVFAFHA